VLPLLRQVSSRGAGEGSVGTADEQRRRCRLRGRAGTCEKIVTQPHEEVYDLAERGAERERQRSRGMRVRRLRFAGRSVPRCGCAGDLPDRAVTQVSRKFRNSRRSVFRESSWLTTSVTPATFGASLVFIDNYLVAIRI